MDTKFQETVAEQAFQIENNGLNNYSGEFLYNLSKSIWENFTSEGLVEFFRITKFLADFGQYVNWSNPVRIEMQRVVQSGKELRRNMAENGSVNAGIIFVLAIIAAAVVAASPTILTGIVAISKIMEVLN